MNNSNDIIIYIQDEDSPKSEDSSLENSPKPEDQHKSEELPKQTELPKPEDSPKPEEQIKSEELPKLEDSLKPELPKQTEPPKLKKLTFIDAYELINKSSNNKISKSSTALDILAIYMKGQKTLYTEAKTFCEQKLNSLMLPAIFISSLCVVLGVSLDSISWGKTLVASLNSFNVFLLSIISYLKLDAKSEAHKTSAYKYDKLQSHCEFLSGRTLFYSDSSDDPVKELKKKEDAKTMINDIEAKVTEIKESNQFILPEYIRYKYPILYSTNVFAEVKKLQNDELVLINQFKELINESITYKNMKQNEEIFNKLNFLDKLVNLKLEEIILHKNTFLDLDDMFTTEIENAIKESKNTYCRTNFFNT